MQGRVSRHVGRGTFLTERFTRDDAQPVHESASPAQIMEVRLILEPQIVQLAATNATAADFARLAHCLAEGEAADGFAGFEQWDGAFHRAIADATHNPFLTRIFATVHAAREEPLWGRLKRRSFSEARRRAYEADHRGIAAALQERDGELARRRMREHIVRVRENLLGVD
jgi:DNA-binding FadR family transcriptional regulator